MFNLQSLVAMASQAMLKKLISSDSMYSQWNTFCRKWGQGRQSLTTLSASSIQLQQTKRGPSSRMQTLKLFKSSWVGC